MPRVPRMAMRMDYLAGAQTRPAREARSGPMQLTPRGRRSRIHARGRARGLTDGRIGKPARHIVVADALPLHDGAALADDPPPVSQHIAEGLERALLPQQAAAEDDDVAAGDGKPVPAVDVAGDVLDAHQEAVLHRVHVDVRRKRAAFSGK